MTKNRILLFRLGLGTEVLVILYLTTTATDYDLAHDVNDKLSHALAFFTLALLADFSFPRNGFTWVKVCPLIAYGILIECIQYFLPYRSFSLLDIVGDIAGIAIYALFIPLLMKFPLLRQRWLDPV